MHMKVDEILEDPKKEDILSSTVSLDRVKNSTMSNNLNQSTNSFEYESINEDSIKFEGSYPVQTECTSMKVDEFVDPIHRSPAVLSPFKEKVQMEPEEIHFVAVDKKVVFS
jgi:hypothetical protein